MTIVGHMTKTPLTTAQVAERLGMLPRRVRRMAAAGKLPGATKLPGITGAYVFDPDVFDAYLQGRAVLGSFPEGAAT